MSTRFLKKLASLAVVLLILWIIYLYHQVPHRRFPFENATTKAAQIILEKGPQKAQLSKSGGEWKIQSGASAIYPADENEVRALLSTLNDVQVEDEISSRADRLPDFEVDGASG